MIRKSFIYFFIVIIITTVRVDAHADDTLRVISLAPAITEIIYAIGGEDLLVGVTSYCDWPAAAQLKEQVGGFINPNLEKIVTLAPDIVILSPNSGTKHIQAQLDRLGIANYVVQFYTIAGLQEAYTIIGEKIGRQAAAARARQELEDTIAAIEAQIAYARKPRVLFVRSHHPLYVAAPGTYEDDVIAIVGGENAVPEGKTRYPHYSVEGIMSMDPEIVIDATFYETPTPDQLAAIREFWSAVRTIKAVRAHKVFVIKTDVHSVPGPRTSEFLRIMAGIVHPDLFAQEPEFIERVRVLYE